MEPSEVDPVREASAFAVHNLTKVYSVGGKDVHALRGGDMGCEKGEFLAVTGPSGSGKTTLLSLIGCLDTPSGGVVWIGSKKVSDLGDRELAKLRGDEIGFVFQSFNLLPKLTALHNIMLPMSFSSKVPRSKRQERAEELLRRVGLGPRMHHRPSQLSGGERQRVSIARSMANDPLLILADEPTGNLDAESGREVMDAFRDLNGQGRTLVVVTHNPAVSAYAGRVIGLRDGSAVVG